MSEEKEKCCGKDKCCCSSQKIITAVSIIVALVAVVYALMGHVEKPAMHEEVAVMEVPALKPQVTEQNPVVLRIDGEDVTRVEVLNNFMQSGAQLPAGAALDQIFSLLQEQYLMGRLITDAAIDAGVDENHPEVQETLRQARDQAIRAVYMEELGKAEVSDDDVRQAYEDIVASAPEVTERKARHILVETQETANALIIRLEQGANFAKLAEDNSTGPTAENGGDLGFFGKDQMVPEFAEAAFGLEIGAFTKQPVQTQFGWHVILVEEERTREKPTFEDARDQLAAQIRQAATQEKIQELRANANVTLLTVNGDPIEEAEAPAEEEAEQIDVMPEEEVTE